MFAQLFDSFRKASESSLQAQQDLFKRWASQWPSLPFVGGSPGEWSEAWHKRWVETTTEALNKQRELIDSTYNTGIEVIEQTFKVGEAKSPEDYRRLVEGLWRKLSESYKAQSEAQFREFQKATDKWLELARNDSAKADAEVRA